MKNKQDIIDKILELEKERKSIYNSIANLSNISERIDFCSPQENAWRRLNNIQGQIMILKWTLK